MEKEQILENVSKNTSYLVSKAEFKELNKNPFIAGILSIGLGTFGVHRIYLKRKLTGLVFLILSISSLGFGSGSMVPIILFISLIEGTIYIATGIILMREKDIDGKGRVIEESEDSVNNEKTSKLYKTKIFELLHRKLSNITSKEVLSFLKNILLKMSKNRWSSKWWDKDGKLRAERQFSNKELNILNATPPRNTIVWEHYSVNKQIIDLYLEIWQIISTGLSRDLNWNMKNKITLERIIYGKYKRSADNDNGKILSSLIKVSENTIREMMPGTRMLNTSKEQDNIKKYFPKEIVDDINNKRIEFKENITDQDLKEILDDMKR